MSEEDVERRLTTILAADVVGYSRLMGKDEAGTLAALKAHRKELIEPKAAQYHGRTVKLMGDGTLMEFTSVVDAVRFAIEVQCAMVERNTGVPEDRQITYRIGINIGDIIVDGEDIYGDGVNIAARLEGLADPGGICISRPVHTQIKGKLDLSFEHLGEKQVKNIADPVSVYRVVMDDKAERLVTAVEASTPPRRLQPALVAAGIVLLVIVGGLAWWQPWPPDAEQSAVETADAPVSEAPTIVVLPFDNLGGDPDEDHISDGISEDLTTDLSRIGSLFVVSRNVAGEVKPRLEPGRRASVNPVEVARTLSADYVLEGSVRRSGTRLRINAQLIDGKSGVHMWAERYDRDSKDVFMVLDEVILKIVTALKVRLTQCEREALEDARAVDPDAWDLLLRGIVELRRFTRDSNKEAETLFLKAAELDPDYAHAWANIAFTLSIRGAFGWTDTPDATIEEAMRYADKALALDDSGVQIYFALHNIHMRRKQLEKAVKAGERIVALDPSNPDGYVAVGVALNYAGRHDECLAALQQALFLAPRGPFFFLWIEGMCLFMLERYEEALARFEKVVEQNPVFIGGLRYLAATQAHLGRIDDAAWTVDEILLLEPDDTLAKEREWLSYVQAEDIERYIEGLRLAGIPE